MELDAQKDLGVWIAVSLKPSLHCAKVAKSAMSLLYLVKRVFAAFTTDSFAQVFGKFVRPQLGSAIQAWRPWVAKDINILEKVQRVCTSQLQSDLKTPVAEDLASINGLLNQLLPPGVEVKVIKAFRIGQKSEDSLETPRPRPLKIMLESKDQIKAILSEKTNLRHARKEVF
ncbi:unnamed protein product [Schistocephalus solidus]|uniref:Uncharacterized protein n=1 Tax=Schistocephalus solidus TaxID=70667 RepID=A0A183TR88_SCHSO|nr:unnamed protein product [Schistocephalus solidus]